MNYNPFDKLFEPRRVIRTTFKQKIQDTFSVFWGEDSLNHTRNLWHRLIALLTMNFTDERIKVGISSYLLLWISVPRYIFGYAAYGIALLVVIGWSILEAIAMLLRSPAFIATFMCSLILTAALLLFHACLGMNFTATIGGVINTGINILIFPLLWLFVTGSVFAAAALVSHACLILSGVAVVFAAVSLGLGAAEYSVRFALSIALTAVSSPIVALVDWYYSAERDEYMRLADEYDSQQHKMDIYSLDDYENESSKILEISYSKNYDSFLTHEREKEEKDDSAVRGASHFDPLFKVNIGGLRDRFKNERLTLYHPRAHFFSAAKELADSQGVFAMQSGFGHEKGNINEMIADYAFPAS